MDTLSRYKKQLQNTNNRLESELEETKKLLASREQVSEEANSLRTCTSNEKSSAISQGFKAMPKKKKKKMIAAFLIGKAVFHYIAVTYLLKFSFLLTKGQDFSGMKNWPIIARIICSSTLKFSRAGQ